MKVQQLAVAQGHRGSGFVRLGQLAQGAEGRASRGVENDGTVSEGRTVVVKNFLELRGVGEVGGEGSRASRASGAGGGDTHRGEDGRLDLVRVNAEALGDLVADERGRAGAGGERILFLASVAEARNLVIVDHDALGSDGLVSSSSHNHRGRDGRRGVGRGDGNEQGLVLCNAIRIGGAVDGGNQADEFTRHDVEGFVGCGDEVGQCIRHVGFGLFVFGNAATGEAEAALLNRGQSGELSAGERELAGGFSGRKGRRDRHAARLRQNSGGCRAGFHLRGFFRGSEDAVAVQLGTLHRNEAGLQRGETVSEFNTSRGSLGSSGLSSDDVHLGLAARGEQGRQLLAEVRRGRAEFGHERVGQFKSLKGFSSHKLNC